MGIVEVKNLSYTYPNASKPAIEDICLSINPGEFVLLTGPSGCGKTTFCRSLNGLIPKFYNGTLTGSVHIAGLDVSEHSTMELAQHIGLIFQNPDNQIFALTVEKDIAFGLENLGISKAEMHREIDWASETTGIDSLRLRATHELSGGQKQRLTIASVLAMHPSIIVMDEPTSFLDPVGAEHIFNVLDLLNKEYGMTIIIIEHRIDIAAKYVNRIIVFDEGRVRSDGKPGLILAQEDTRLLGVGIPRILELAMRFDDHDRRFSDLPLTSTQFYDQITACLRKKEFTSKKSLLPPDMLDLVGEHHHSPLIQARNIVFDYPGNVHALRDVDLTINHGDYVAIMGENGAGKTTLVKHFNGLLRPKEGEILLDGEDISKQSVAQLARRVGLVFQNPDDQLFEESVEKEIAFALRNFGMNEESIEKRVTWALNLLDLNRYRERSPFILSGGERKRVALASVLAWDPDILVLDEPTIGQDYGQKERLRHFLTQLRTQGKTVVIVTHDVEFVAESQPHIVLMAGGNVVAEGSTKSIMNQTELLAQCSVAQPEITRLFNDLESYGLPKDVVDVDEAYQLLKRKIEEAE
ncbi:ATP-binding cassette domain-containing protein [Candidatus Bathyarchaeota archaeon]|nr:ATP-binding cassette domain-containing protein [Candidatus Bathyarchaeota archaeon]MBT4320634.1 ATP-binding cassette domain-containing protein [Candidatus Bathyarchaeota archaeon]MBT4424131.1 ATP-binding cassette domain-containing protein [Candidatus Bathyarchaeota archaeon]MBT6604094.1 ATP-binding cassette domain-containing protein [Candidatus Bathyarchaeota archaeon]MBT7188123.1 ATP-binding cassette domain-containing protein [Candidatus Bathyarchaeota archaeon]